MSDSLTEAERDYYAIHPGRLAARFLVPQSAMVERVAARIPPPCVSERVVDWPTDEQDFHRFGDWNSFTERAEMLDRIRRVKVARAVLTELGVDALGVTS